jgi:hypothetical protein
LIFFFFLWFDSLLFIMTPQFCGATCILCMSSGYIMPQEVCVYPPGYLASRFVVFIISGVGFENVTNFVDFFLLFLYCAT